MKNMQILTLSLYLFSTLALAESPLEQRLVLGAQTAAITGNLALWHNPAGLAFMGGQESSLLYFFESTDLGKRHHGGANVAMNVGHFFTVAGGLISRAAFSAPAKAHLGSELLGSFGFGLRPSNNLGLGISFLKSHNFLTQTTGPWLLGFGLQLRAASWLSLGALYEAIHGSLLDAPQITAGVSLRPYKEFLTLGLDGKWRSKGKNWDQGFSLAPIFSLRTDIGGYGASISAEIPSISDGWSKPIFALTLDLNWAHMGIGLAGQFNASSKAFLSGGSIRFSSDEWPSVKPQSGQWVALTIDHRGNLETGRSSFAERLLETEPSPLMVLALLNRIKSDASIMGVVLSLRGFAFGDAKTQEWRDAILALRKADKEVIVYLDSPSERDYYIASAANKIFMNKEASLSLKRFQATLTYFADLLEKIGVKADAVYAGSYKTAPRQWTHSRPQKEEVEVMNNILNSFYDTILSDISIARGIERTKLKLLFDKGEITASEAKESSLVDELINADAAVAKVRDEKNGDLPLFAGYPYRSFKQVAWQVAKKIAVIPISDAIVEGRVYPGFFGSFSAATGAQDVIDEIDAAVEDPEVVGIIIRIDSPGGDAVAGQRIHQALMKAQKEKPVVASMADVAASAGYLIASGTGHIVAMPNTITGSIGVFSLMFSAEKLAARLGVHTKELSPIKYPGPTLFRGITKAEKEQSQQVVSWYYQNFIQAVSEGRTISKEVVAEHADGHVWLGHEAEQKKLIDELGGFSKAIEVLRKKAAIPDEESLSIEIYRPGDREQLSLPSKLLSMIKPSSSLVSELKPLTPLMSPYLKAMNAYRLNNLPQARLPFELEWPNPKADSKD